MILGREEGEGGEEWGSTTINTFPQQAFKTLYSRRLKKAATTSEQQHGLFIENKDNGNSEDAFCANKSYRHTANGAT